MNKIYLIFLGVCLFFLSSPGQISDLGVIKSIFEKNNLDWNIEEVATFNNGRIIELNLNNKNIAQKGITKLHYEIGLLTELRILTINDNDLTYLPKEILNCTKLTKLEIKNNNLLSIPSDIGKLSHLKVLDLRNNKLKELPPEIGKLKLLSKLQLWGNELISLPSEIGKLSSLRELYLRGNRLTGLPLSITKLKLTYLDMLENQLCDVPRRVDRWLQKYDVNYEMLQYCMGRNYRFRIRGY